MRLWSHFYWTGKHNQLLTLTGNSAVLNCTTTRTNKLGKDSQRSQQSFVGSQWKPSECLISESAYSESVVTYCEENDCLFRNVLVSVMWAQPHEKEIWMAEANQIQLHQMPIRFAVVAATSTLKIVTISQK